MFVRGRPDEAKRLDANSSKPADGGRLPQVESRILAYAGAESRLAAARVAVPARPSSLGRSVGNLIYLAARLSFEADCTITMNALKTGTAVGGCSAGCRGGPGRWRLPLFEF